MSVKNVRQKLKTKTRRQTISSQSSTLTTVLPDGTLTPPLFTVESMDFKSSAGVVTIGRLQTKESRGKKHDEEKEPLAYIPLAALKAEGSAFKHGAKKYDAWNYKNGIAVTRTVSAAVRHIYQFLSGENVDAESGAHHLGCARANLAMALDTLENHSNFDDRYKGKK